MNSMVTTLNNTGISSVVQGATLDISIQTAVNIFGYIMGVDPENSYLFGSVLGTTIGASAAGGDNTPNVHIGDDIVESVNNTITITSTLGNEIDVTPSSNHTSVYKNPGPYGEPNSSVDILDADGNVMTRRWYGANGKAYRDVDMSNHGNPKEHPEVPHEHTWEYNNGKPKRN